MTKKKKSITVKQQIRSMEEYDETVYRIVKLTNTIDWSIGALLTIEELDRIIHNKARPVHVTVT